MGIGGNNMLYTLHYYNNYSESIRTNIDKPVHENHIFALHRAITENNNADATAVFVTNGRLSDKAREIAEHVGFNVVRVNEDMHMIIVAND